LGVWCGCWRGEPFGFGERRGTFERGGQAFFGVLGSVLVRMFGSGCAADFG